MSTTSTTTTTTAQEELPLESPAHLSSSITSSFTVDYSWRKNKVLISETCPSDPDLSTTDSAPSSSTTTGKPLYTVDYCVDHLTFREASTRQIIGSGENHLVSINAEYQVNNHTSTIRAASRVKTSYTHLSHAFASSSPSKAPVPMHWTARSDLKYWDFTCVDAATREPVARFHSNVWCVRRLGKLEFMGARAQGEEVKRELMVVALTIYNQMLIRIGSPLSLLGMLPKPRPFTAAGDGQEVVTRERAAVGGGDEGEWDAASVELQSQRPKAD